MYNFISKQECQIPVAFDKSYLVVKSCTEKIRFVHCYQLEKKECKKGAKENHKKYVENIFVVFDNMFDNRPDLFYKRKT